MRVLIHCNGGPDIGVGHVMRSLALAEEAVASGHEVTFVGEYDGAFVLNQLDTAPVDARRVARSDAWGLAVAVGELAPDVIHLDTYEPVRLEGPSVVLEPLSPEHAPLLWPKAGPDVFQYTLEWPRDESLAAFEDWVRHFERLGGTLRLGDPVKHGRGSYGRARTGRHRCG